ncbi:lysozyme family protein [Peribacillus asahii]|nr:lysozyme family protein [Peribacillus asahii]USK72758.1 lysozyme family protein [Peribacillus asahii]
MRYEPLVRKYAEKYGVESYVPLLLAKMMQESGGRLPDVMQSSESLGLPRNAITDPEYSIDVGVKYFAGIIKKTKGDVKLALQSYNFGQGFIDYALKRGGYSKAVAVEFSNMMAAKMGWSRYGDINYVSNVLRYLENDSGGSGTVSAAAPGSVSSYGFMRPVSGHITSPFGYRIHPITGERKLHEGLDFTCQKQYIPIRVAKSGKVVRAGWENPNDHGQGYGQRVYVEHGKGQVTVYAHLSKILVSVGQTISQGQTVGNCGNTGGSKGIHLHFEIHIDGRKVNPAPYL